MKATYGMVMAAVLMWATAMPAAEQQAKNYPCWRNDGSGAGPDCGKPMLTDFSKATWVWESEERRMSSCYGHLQGGIGCMAVAEGTLFHPYAYPGGEPDAAFKALLIETYTKALAWKEGKEAKCLTRTLGTTGMTSEQFAEVMAKPLMYDHVVAIDTATGKTRWTFEAPTTRPNIYGRTPDGKVGSLSHNFKPKGGPHNTPAVAYGKVAVFGCGGTLYCLDAATGKKAWQVEVKLGNLHQASVLFGAGRFIGNTPKGWSAFDAATGAVAWTWNPGYTPCGKQGPVRFVQANRELMLYGATCVDLANGKPLWSAEGAVVAIGSPCVGEGYAVFGGAEKKAGMSCYRLDPDPAKAPTTVWVLDAKYAAVHDCTPVIHRGWVYTKMSNADQVPGGDCVYVALELATGKKLQIASHSDSHASMVAGDGRIIYEGYVFSAAPDFKSLPGVSEFFKSGDNSACFANSHTPPLVDGRLYIKGNNSIRCLDLRDQK